MEIPAYHLKDFIFAFVCFIHDGYSEEDVGEREDDMQQMNAGRNQKCDLM